MRIGVIADAHGNLTALEAVMAKLHEAAPDATINLGDLISGPFDPAGSAEVQMQSSYLTIAGNHERQLLNSSQGPLDVLSRPLLTSEHWTWIKSLPPTLRLAGGEVFACHGSPAGGDLEYLLEDVSTGRVLLDIEENILPRLAGIGNARLVLCGHTHTPRIAAIGDVLVVNPGSVGMPGYRDRWGVPHVMETGSPLARFAIVERRKAGWSAELHAVPYDYDVPARQAEAHGFPAIAVAVRTGRMPAE